MGTETHNPIGFYITTTAGSAPLAGSGMVSLAIGSCSFENRFSGETVDFWTVAVTSDGGDCSRTWEESAIEKKLSETGMIVTDGPLPLPSFEYLLQTSCQTAGEVARTLAASLEMYGEIVYIAKDIGDHSICSQRYIL
ncbi:MAG: hypothetical protein HGB34_00740 [Candidatus Moranbacteria bacterium]|nr:hypothetical protein [Candidatus Moranbacteria bacterium]